MSEHDPKKLSELLSIAIRKCRQSLAVSEEEFANRLGKPVGFVRAIEEAKVEQPASTFIACAKALDMSLTELLEIAAADYDVVLLTEQADCEREDVEHLN